MYGDVFILESDGLPSESDSKVEVANGFKYFVLRNTNGILAVYRVLESERLRRLRRYPKELKRS